MNWLRLALASQSPILRRSFAGTHRARTRDPIGLLCRSITYAKIRFVSFPQFPGKSRDQIVVELRLRLDRARSRWDACTRNAAVHDPIIADAAGTADGTLAAARSTEKMRQLHEALLEYSQALRIFTDFIVHGRLPEGD